MYIYICIHCDHVVVQGLTLQGVDSYRGGSF